MSRINQHSKISAIIKANPDSIDAIAAIARPFCKLKIPLLRRLMAPRVTVAQAAAIGGCTVDDFRLALEPLGFIFDIDTTATSQTEFVEPVWLGSLTPETTDHFDVRHLITQGDDPLQEIMQRYQSLPEHHALCITNSFIPYPLLQVLGRKGAQHHIQSQSADLHQTWFYKAAIPSSQEVDRNDHIMMLDNSSFEAVLADYPPEYITVLNVREMPMPLPMEVILQAVAELQERQILHVYHKRVPLHLMEELEDSAFQIRLCEYGREDIRLLIHHATR